MVGTNVSMQSKLTIKGCLIGMTQLNAIDTAASRKILKLKFWQIQFWFNHGFLELQPQGIKEY